MKYTAIIEALNPIAHGDTSMQRGSNETVFMRSKRLVQGNVINVPDVSENAIRHVIFREPLANHLFNTVKPENMRRSVVSLFFSGGNMNEKAPGDQNTLSRQVYQAFPMLELLGGAVNQFILPRSALKLVAIPIAREYMPYLQYLLSDEQKIITIEQSRLSIFDFLSTETRTRGTGGEDTENQMIYGYETLAAGSQFFIQATVNPKTSSLAVSALGAAITLWDGYFGAQARQGRGLCTIRQHDFPDDQEYRNYIEQKATDLKTFLELGTLGTSKELCKD